MDYVHLQMSHALVRERLAESERARLLKPTGGVAAPGRARRWRPGRVGRALARAAAGFAG